MMEELLKKVKQNLILEHNEDNDLLTGYITAAISYAESYQHIPAGAYQIDPMPPTTELFPVVNTSPVTVTVALVAFTSV